MPDRTSRIKPIFVNCLLCSHRLLLRGVDGVERILTMPSSINHARACKAAFRSGACGAAEHPANAFADKLLHVVLYITLLSSFFVIIEPAPYEYLVAVLGFACVLARVSFAVWCCRFSFCSSFAKPAGAIGLSKFSNSDG